MGSAFRTTDIGIPVDCPNLMLLFYVVQLFLRELCKSKNLIRIVPMDMTEYYGNFSKHPIFFYELNILTNKESYQFVNLLAINALHTFYLSSKGIRRKKIIQFRINDLEKYDLFILEIFSVSIIRHTKRKEYFQLYINIIHRYIYEDI